MNIDDVTASMVNLSLEDRRRTPRVFRLLDLPQELIDKVLEQYFGRFDLNLELSCRAARTSSTVSMRTSCSNPELSSSLQLSCRKLAQDVRNLRHAGFTGVVKLKVLHNSDLAALVQLSRLRSGTTFGQLAALATKLEITGLNVHNTHPTSHNAYILNSVSCWHHWELLPRVFPHLEEVHVQISNTMFRRDWRALPAERCDTIIDILRNGFENENPEMLCARYYRDYKLKCLAEILEKRSPGCGIIAEYLRSFEGPHKRQVSERYTFDITSRDQKLVHKSFTDVKDGSLTEVDWRGQAGAESFDKCLRIEDAYYHHFE